MYGVSKTPFSYAHPLVPDVGSQWLPPTHTHTVSRMCGCTIQLEIIVHTSNCGQHNFLTCSNTHCCLLFSTWRKVHTSFLCLWMHNIQFQYTFFIYYIFMGWARTHSLITVPIYSSWHRPDSLWICCINVYKAVKSDLSKVIFPAKATLCFRQAYFHIYETICLTYHCNEA